MEAVYLGDAVHSAPEARRCKLVSGQYAEYAIFKGASAVEPGRRMSLLTRDGELRCPDERRFAHALRS